MRPASLILALLLAASATIASSQAASAWQLAGFGGDAAGFFDQAHTSKKDGVVATIQLWVFVTPRTDAGDKPYTWALMNSRFDCAQKTRQVLTFAAYDDGDHLVASGQVDQPPEAIEPETVNEKFLDAVCSGDFSGESAFATVKDARSFARAYFEGQAKPQGGGPRR
jgi:hypothetical protein